MTKPEQSTETAPEVEGTSEDSTNDARLAINLTAVAEEFRLFADYLMNRTLVRASQVDDLRMQVAQGESDKIALLEQVGKLTQTLNKIQGTKAQPIASKASSPNEESK